jgi:hypothetical protein
MQRAVSPAVACLLIVQVSMMTSSSASITAFLPSLSMGHKGLCKSPQINCHLVPWLCRMAAQAVQLREVSLP